MRDLIESNAPLRNGSHKARQNGPKHYPRGFKGPQPLDTPFSPIFRRATKDGAVGDRRLPSAAGKNVPPKITAYSPRTFIASPAPNTDPQTTIRFPSSIFAISIAPEKLSLQSALQ